MYLGENASTRPARATLVLVLLALFVVLAVSGCGGADAAVTSKQSGAIVPASDETTTSEVEDDVATDDSGAKGIANDEPAPIAHPIAWKEATDKVADGARLLCVDRSDEYDVEHVAGSTNVPAGKIDDESDGWKKDSPIILTSAQDQVSRSVASHMARDGFTAVYYLSGGHDEWGGSFEGSDPRKATTPSMIYYIHATDDLVNLGDDDMTEEEFVALTTELAASTKALGVEFEGDIDVELIDGAYELSRAFDLAHTYDVPTLDIAGTEILLTPCWILIDKDGRSTYLNGIGINISTSALYGWCCEQAAE